MAAKGWLVVAALGVVSTSALAGTLNTYTFHRITSNVPGNAVTEQVRMDLVDTGLSGQVEFKFYFTSFATSMVVAKSYWDDAGGLLASTGSTTSSSSSTSHKISYLASSPGNFAGSNAIDFVESRQMDAVSPAPQRGIRAEDDHVSFRFQLSQGTTINDVLHALELGGTDPANRVPGSMRIGLHITGIDGGGSDSFVNNPLIVPVPLPGTAGLAAAGMLAVVGVRRRRMF